MIAQDEKILFVSNARVIAIIKDSDSLYSGFIQKKVVLTTRRCMVFQSLGNKVKQMEYEVLQKRGPTTNKDGKQEKKPKLSVNGYPEFWFSAAEREVRVVIEQQPSIMALFSKMGIKNLVRNTVGMVLSKNIKKEKFQVFVFPGLKESFRFAKGLMCAKAWLIYEKHCQEQKLPLNLLWVRILQQIVAHEHSLTLIDPDLFQTGQTKQINAFYTLITNISFAHSFQLRYSMVNQQSLTYTVQFLQNLQKRVHSLTMSQVSLTSQSLIKILTSNLKTKNLMKLNLEHNELTDKCFTGLQALCRQNKKLSYINLSHNKITLGNFSNLLEFMKMTPIILNLNLSHNKITDRAVQNIEKYILFALNPPIEEIDFSFNELTLKGAWRLYMGFLKNFRNHVYLNFIVYPIPFKKEIFSEVEVDFPRHEQQMNFNMHSALISQFQQQSMMKHTLNDILVPTDTVTIKFIRQLLPNVRLPKNKQQMSKTLDLSNRIQNFIYSTNSVERIFDLAVQMKSFPFEVPPRTRNNFVFYLNKKLNEALLIRDHYSIKYILKSMKELQIPYPGYFDRLERVNLRDKIFSKRLESVLQFRHQQVTINKEIDELTKEGLRLYLQGRGIQLLYFLKYSRDQNIQRLLMQRYNPQHQLYGKMAAKNLSNDDKVTSKDFVIPYEIKIQKKINENFYLHPWQTNYLILSQMTPKAFVQCLQFLQESEKRQTFAKYFQRIEQRVQFIQNEFTIFTYKQFKVSYTDLKVNPCRLLFLYKNIQDMHFYLEIPIYIKKRPITCQRQIRVNNPEQFIKKYHIVNYPNINYEAKKHNLYNYPGIITRYQSQTFDTEALKALKILNTFILFNIETYIHGRRSREDMIDKILTPLKELIDLVRHAIYPEEIKEEIYLHLICWKKGKYGRNAEVIEMIPWLTMYLKPPLQLEKYLVASILEAKYHDLDKFPLCIVSDVNKPTSDDILKMDQQFVQRDWIPTDNIIKEQILNYGKLNVQIHLLDKRKIQFKIAQSTNISQLMNYIMGFHQLNCPDRQCFWLYILDKQTQQTRPLTGSDYIGEIMSLMNFQNEMFICRRRIYSRELKYVFMLYGEVMIDSLYSEIKFDYMMRGLYDNDKNIYDITSLFFIIDNIENFDIIVKKDPKFKDRKIDQYILDQINRIDLIYPSYIPRPIMARIMKDKETIFNQIKAKVSERMLKKQHAAIYEMKTKFIRHFQNIPQFCSTNYKMFDNDSTQLKVFVNSMYLYIQSQNQKEYIKLQKIISIIPKTKYVLISYHRNQNVIGQIPLFSDEINILAISMDLLTYCLMRLKMASNNLYEINKYERIQWQIYEQEKSLKKVYNRSLQEKLIKNRQQRQNIQAKIMKMSITLMDLKQLIYYNESRYIKSFLDRKLYANKSQRKMAYSVEMDEEEARETQNWNHNLFKTIFPSFQEKYMGKDDSMGIYGQNPGDGDYDEGSEYDVDFYTQPQVIIKDKNEPKPEDSPYKPTERKPQQPQSQQDPQMTTTARKQPPPPLKLQPKPMQQPKPIQQSKPVQQPKPSQPQKPYQSLIKPAQQPAEIQSPTKPPPVKPPQSQPSVSQPPSNQLQPPEQDEQVVLSNKKSGGRNIPPRRRQR